MDNKDYRQETEKNKEPGYGITMDFEGRIQSIGPDIETLLGFTHEDVADKKRFSIFFPGSTVITELPEWMASASRDGSFKKTVRLICSDGKAIAADLEIIAEADDPDAGMRAMINHRPDINPDELLSKTGFKHAINKWAKVTRAPFLSATLGAVLVGGAYSSFSGLSPFPWHLFLAACFGACLLHLAANVFNDYFDWKSGTDPGNNDYFSPFTGGSRAVELGLATEKKLFLTGLGLVIGAGLIGIYLVYIQGPALILFGLAGALSGYFYTAPPLRLVARRGLGEFLIMLNFGPLMTAGTIYAISGSVNWTSFAIGLPPGLLTAAILWINQFPDAESDGRAGKNHMVVVLGKSAARWGYIAIVMAAFAVVVAGVLIRLLPPHTLLVLAGLPMAFHAFKVLIKHYSDRKLVSASASTIKLQAMVGILLSAGLLLGGG